MNHFPEFFQAVYQARSMEDMEDVLERTLRDYGFENTKTAWKNLTALAGQANFVSLFPGFFPTLMELISNSYDADLALTNFERFTEKIHDKDYLYTLLSETPLLLKALVVLFSGSQVLTDSLLQDPSHVDWLKHPDTLSKPRSVDTLMRDFYDMAGKDYLTNKLPAFLRRFKKREYIRIGLRDLLGEAEMHETVEDISNLADVCLQIAYEYSDHECRKKYGVPYYQDPEGNWIKSEFTVLGMGKLGGKELNFSSDIDLIYIYTSSMGETRPDESTGKNIVRLSNHEYFTKLAQLLTKTIHEITPDGNVFRVDLDLRPEGRSGEIANSLASCEIYYQSWGRTWERQALMKARICAGSISLGKEFFSLLSPFIYRRSLDFSAIEEIKSMKEKINASLKKKRTGKGDIKLGFGGIREIEFTVQSYQLLFGGRDPNLRVANTLRLLEKLRDCKFLLEEDYSSLKEAYVFLRNLENRVQISFGLQTHVLPEDERQLAVLARKMGLTGNSTRELSTCLMQEFRKHTQFVGNMFANLFVEAESQEAAEKVSRETQGGPLAEDLLSEDYLGSEGISDPKRVLRFLESLRDGPQFSHPTEKSIQEFYFILPQILDLCANVPKPNSAVENLVKFVEASGARETYLSLFKSSGKFLELLLILFGSSDFLSQTLIKQPDLVDVLMDLESIYRFKPTEKIAEDWKKTLTSCKNFESKKIALRRLKQGEELRVGIRYLIKETDLMGTLADLSNLADVYMQSAVDCAYEELNKRSGKSFSLPDDFAVFGLGKLGGHELNFGSDLDVIFVYDEPTSQDSALSPGEMISHYVNLSQLIYQLTAEMTPAGYAYKIDTDLRPEGGSGVLALSVKAYAEYFKTRARVWEQQAMTRIRFVAGKPELGEKFLRVAHEFTYRKKFEYGSLIEISRLRERMEKELAKETKKGKNVKLGYGGLVDIEFTLQILQLMNGYRNPRLRVTNMLEVLKLVGVYGIMDQSEADNVMKNYLFLRNLECALRIVTQPFSNYLPKDEESLGSLAILLGYQGSGFKDRADKLLHDYDNTTKEVREYYRKTLDHWLRTSL